jgi:hypothetical protein
MRTTTQNETRKFADWCIVDVHHERPNRQGRIVAVDVRPDLGEQLGAERLMNTPEVMARWAHGETFCTVTLVDGKRWRFGAMVVPELRTVPDGDPENNLD